MRRPVSFRIPGTRVHRVIPLERRGRVSTRVRWRRVTGTGVVGQIARRYSVSTLNPRIR